jgi:hypothetical protein
VTSIIALLIQVVPPRDERTIVAAMSAPTGTPESAASSAAAAIEAKKPKRTPLPSPWRLSELAKDPTVTIASATMDRRSFVEALA